MIYFVLYERLRLSIGHWRGITLDEDRRMYDFLIIMMASAVCKSTACCLAYPHGKLGNSSVYWAYYALLKQSFLNHLEMANANFLHC